MFVLMHQGIQQPYHAKCALCEAVMTSDPKTAREFRGLYRPNEHGGLVVTNAAMMASDHFFTTSVGGGADFRTVQLAPIAREGQRNGRPVLIFHEPCWKILEAASHPDPLPLERLYGLCNSIPPSFRGHGQGMGQFHYEMLHTANPKYMNYNAYHVPYLRDILAEPSPNFEKALANWEPSPLPPYHRYQGAPAKTRVTTTSQNTTSKDVASTDSLPGGKDYLTQLSPELCSAIAIHLSTPDFLNARVACRAFWSIFHSQQFWASRFAPDAELAHIFEARDLPRDHDFRWLYHRVREGNHDSWMVSRHTIWEDAKRTLGYTAYPFSAPSNHSFTDQQTKRMTAVEPTQPIHGGTPSFKNSKPGFHRYDVVVPRDLSQLTIYTIRLKDATQICGITLTPAAGEPIEMGYQSPESKSIHIPRPITGLHMAVGPFGMHALQCAFEGGEKSPWLGSPRCVPHTYRIVFSSPITHITTFFDGVKLYVVCASPSPSTPPEPEEAGLGIRTRALWFPNVPGPGLNLNEAQFTEAKAVTGGFRIVNHMSFGGPGGRLLKHLTRISASSIKGIHRLTWFYDQRGLVPWGSNSFGWIMRREERENSLSIDGPGGERVTRAEMYILDKTTFSNGIRYVDDSHPEETLWGLRLHTNRGRSGLLFGEEKWLNNNHHLKVISIEPENETITGFYVIEGSSISFRAVGVISEAIQDVVEPSS